MGEYRAYVIGADGHMALRVDLVVPDETTARKRAKQLVNGHAVELWEGATTSEHSSQNSDDGLLRIREPADLICIKNDGPMRELAMGVERMHSPKYWLRPAEEFSHQSR